MAWRWAAALLVLGLTTVKAEDDLAPGKFLVAGRDLRDPNFAEAVVLLVDYDADHGAMGLIINRRTDVPLSKVFTDLKEAKNRTDPVYLGGPVELNSVLALIKSTVNPGEAKRVFGDLYLVNTKGQMQKALAERTEASSFHVFVGYAGWGESQLEHEVDLGAWHVMSAESALVFHTDPDSIWQRLIKRTEQQIASLPDPAAHSARKVSSGPALVARLAGK